MLQIIFKREIKETLKGFVSGNSHIFQITAICKQRDIIELVFCYSDNDSDSSSNNLYSSYRSAGSEIIIDKPFDKFSYDTDDDPKFQSSLETFSSHLSYSEGLYVYYSEFHHVQALPSLLKGISNNEDARSFHKYAKPYNNTRGMNTSKPPI